MDRLKMPAALRQSIEAKQAAPFAVFPENAFPVEVFRSMQTQWIFASGGMGPPVRVGLRREVLDRHIALEGVPAEQHDDVFRDVIEMEFAYLAALAEMRK